MVQNVEAGVIEGAIITHLQIRHPLPERRMLEERIITHHHGRGPFHDPYLPLMMRHIRIIVSQRVQGRMKGAVTRIIGQTAF